ncbi:hypothetical protein [Agriterribacter sp.]|uniref:hypothetical protein n=1 Tax=Agriterribacter sp. TaxID=2821509 RepID=UPI002BB2D2E2|nr:hypothetical protein [Agriterribacter sp.]HRO46108.1 hypothetical protein [Agriterribacter sp.]HRQ16168.1 hypothetical protein [Agriterribacter sp.]
MKKILFGLLICGMAPVLVSSCKKEKKVDCTSAAKRVADAVQTYAANINSANCKAYKAALQEYLETDCVTGLSAEEKAAYQSALSGLTCD